MFLCQIFPGLVPTKKMPAQDQFCCATLSIPISASNSYLLTSFLQALSNIPAHQPPQRPRPASLPSKTSLLPLASTSNITSTSHSVYYSARSHQPTPLFHPFPLDEPLPATVIELETIQDAEKNNKRRFSQCYYAVLPNRSWHEEQTFPEECKYIPPLPYQTQGNYSCVSFVRFWRS